MSSHAARPIVSPGAAAAQGRPPRTLRPAVPGPALGAPAFPPVPPPPLPPLPAARPPVEIEPRHFKNVLGRYATGIVAITAIDPADGAPRALVANSFTSVSLDPPLVSFCVSRTSRTWPRLRAAGRLCVNVLAEHQEHVSRALASRAEDRFAGIRWRPSPGGHPLIEDAIAWIDCAVRDEHPAGDHVIVVARVLALEAHADHGPLVYFRGSYGRLGDRP
ncbi:hypothetical protein Sru01_32020 [Sphaerisporangium rufum]|uniref:Flavin reductase like domain-containing protein n=1 Tax=Sphaerisporangium rufum TaxID=1381558 RepID=A0A919R4K5_9ACTN|nr:flavin reductase family protein [Sphaerisporangium rufum]GII78220.1 hypothetical protein Sru01_32020 [Sphaerisporangium rufum]